MTHITNATQALRGGTRTIPIVFVNLSDPVATGIVSNLARPEANLTGFMSFEHSLAGKWLSLLKDMAPRLTRVALLFKVLVGGRSAHVERRGRAADASPRAYYAPYVSSTLRTRCSIPCAMKSYFAVICFIVWRASVSSIVSACARSSRARSRHLMTSN